MSYKWLVVAMLWLVCFFNYADRQAIFSVFPLLKNEMNLSDVQLGIVGSDTLDELDLEVLELADLGFGGCRLSLCAPSPLELEDLRRRPHLRLATKFERATAAWLDREGLTAELVPLQSSVELAPVLGLADVAGLRFYTGPTLRLWAPGARQELAAGGRYDGLFPQLGRPWYAAGFCVRLSRCLDLEETRPNLFEGPPS